MSERLVRWSRLDLALWLMVAFGMAVRLRQFFFNRSLWLDEAMLGINIVERPLGALMGPLEFGQHAPLGFLVIEKAIISVVGASDLALRLYPLLCSLAALVLALILAVRTMPRVGALVCLGVLATCEKLVHFSSELKQYSSDVAITLVLIGLALRYRSENGRVSNLLLLAIVGAGALWLSHPSAFVLGGVGMYLLAVDLRRSPRGVIALVPVATAWGLSFAAVYYASLATSVANNSLQSFWQAYFMPFPPTSADDLRWFLFYPFHVFSDPLALAFPGLGAFLFAIGSLHIASLPERRLDLILFLSPIALTLAASALHQYPFGLRLLLFLVPIFALLIGHGVSALWESGGAAPRSVALAAIALVFLHPAVQSVYHVGKPRMVEELRPLLAEMRADVRDGDLIYVHAGAVPAFRFYAAAYGYDMSRAALESWERTGPEQVRAWLQQRQPGERCWLLFSHFDPGRAEPTVRAYRDVLESRGGERARPTEVSAWAFLYELER